MLTRTFFRYCRYARAKIPALSYCLAFVLHAIIHGILITAAFLMTEGEALDFWVGVLLFSPPLANTVFLLVVASLTGREDDWLARKGKLLLIPVVLLFFVYLTNNQHHLIAKPVVKDAQGFSFDVEMERPIRLEAGKTYKLRVFVQDTILLAYLGDEAGGGDMVALNTRMFDSTCRKFGLFASDGDVKFENMKLRT